MSKSNSGFNAVLSGSFSVEPRQICRFDYLTAVAIWLLWFNELKPLLSRYCSCTNCLSVFLNNVKEKTAIKLPTIAPASISPR